MTEAPPDSPPAATGQDDLRTRLGALHDRLRLRDVRLERILGEVVGEPPLQVGAVSFTMDDPEVLVQPPRFACRFVLRLGLLDEEEGRLASVEVSLLLEFEIEGDELPDPEAVRLYVDRNAFFIGYPYLREAVQNTTMKLGLDPVVLGVLGRGDERPTELTLVQRST